MSHACMHNAHTWQCWFHQSSTQPLRPPTPLVLAHTCQWCFLIVRWLAGAHLVLHVKTKPVTMKAVETHRQHDSHKSIATQQVKAARFLLTA